MTLKNSNSKLKGQLFIGFCVVVKRFGLYSEGICKVVSFHSVYEC